METLYLVRRTTSLEKKKIELKFQILIIPEFYYLNSKQPTNTTA